MNSVYCIQEGGDGAVKIGWTTGRSTDRLINLQTGNPRPLVLRGVIKTHRAQKVEREIHAEIAEHWVLGEWFHPHDDVFAAFEGARHRHKTELRAIGNGIACGPSAVQKSRVA